MISIARGWFGIWTSEPFELVQTFSICTPYAQFVTLISNAVTPFSGVVKLTPVVVGLMNW